MGGHLFVDLKIGNAARPINCPGNPQWIARQETA
jgi:hypothetical protein